MDQIHSDRKPKNKAAEKRETAQQQSSIAALRSGAVAPTPEQRGRPVDLPEAMRSKMENAFGADLSSLKLYESQAVADAGSRAVTRGSDIAFAPGLADFTSFGGQALLGHEISHVVSQARGEVTGGGFLNDRALEARADREGAMAAAGEQIAMPTAAMSPVSAADAAGPMQAKVKPWEKNQEEFPEDETPASPEPDSGKTDSSTSGNLIDTLDENGQYIGGELDSGPPPEADFSDIAPETGEAEAASDSGGLISDKHNEQGDRILVEDAAAAPSPDTKPDDAPKEWGFAQDSDEKYDLPSDVIGSTLGSSNAEDRKHGAEYAEMMSAVNTLNSVKGKRQDLDGMVYSAMLGNAYDAAIAGMEKYRKKLKGEWGNRTERHRQIDLLDEWLATARSDRERNASSQEVTIGKRDLTDTFVKGGVNQVQRMVRGGQNAYFKPEKSAASSSGEKAVMDRIGIAHGAGDKPNLSNREVAYTLLGRLLGTEVTVGAKTATMGADTGAAGQKGVLTEEAKGKRFSRYNWSFFDLEGRKKDDKTGAGLQVRTSRDADFQGFSGEYFDDTGDMLDSTDEDFQRQMNQMFLLDTLAAHTDRHIGNFHVDRSADKKLSVKAIDNDLTFGDLGRDANTGRDMNAVAFGKRRELQSSYSGLPEQMQIDRAMAEKIRGMDRQTLDLTFGGLLDKKEIDALWTRFVGMKTYIDSMEEADSSLLVTKWGDATARREAAMASESTAFAGEDREYAGGYKGNSYYQRHLQMLNAARRGKMEGFHEAIGK